jgi:hypothetical protein
VAAAAAARLRRIQQTVDSFRLAGATAPERSRRLEDVGVLEDGETRDLIVEGVLLPGPHEGTYYLSEAAYIYQRDARRGRLKVVMVVMVALLLLGAILIPLMAVRS